MRMTNKIMQNNSLYNINNNKILQDKLSTQMSTQKKLTRPSDDPVVAIRALRLRTSVSELTQFLDKNAQDAESWLTVTSDALAMAGDVLGGSSGLIKLMDKAANMDIGSEDLQILMEQIKSLRDELYATANVDYAGRYVFTGYRTDTPLSFNDEVEDRTLSYNITEQTTLDGFDSVNYVNQGDVKGLNKSNYQGIAVDENDVDIENNDIHRLQLAYDNTVPGTVPNISYEDPSVSPPTVPPTMINLTPAPITISLADSPDPYQRITAANDFGMNTVVYVPETGELLFSNRVHADLTGAITPEAEIRVTYAKNEWKQGDLSPEHYFACTSTETMPDGSTETVNYNQEYLNSNHERQSIEYDVGYNQRITINTTAQEVFTHGVDRRVDDLDRAVSELAAIDATVKDLEGIFSELQEGDADYALVQKQLDAAKKAHSAVRNNVHKMFEHSITNMQEALDDMNLAVTENGTRSARLDLIGNRLLSQKTTFQVLQSENEDADISEVAVKLTSTELSYNAALMATGKIMQTSLMNYI